MNQYIYYAIDVQATKKAAVELLQKHNLEPTKVYQQLGYTHPNGIYNWKDEKRGLPSLDTLVQLSHMTGTPLDDIIKTRAIGGDDKSPSFVFYGDSNCVLDAKYA